MAKKYCRKFQPPSRAHERYHHHRHHHHHILFPSQYRNNRYSAIRYRIIEMVGCQKSKCSLSWPPIRPITFICIVNIQTFIPTFTQTQYTNGNRNKCNSATIKDDVQPAGHTKSLPRLTEMNLERLLCATDNYRMKCSSYTAANHRTGKRQECVNML